MKRILKIAAVALFIMLGSSWQSDLVAQPYPPEQYNQYNDDGEVTYQEFYDELSPHGRWVDHPQHGYIWIPDAGPDFRPYSTDGHWVWTENYEWMWVSDFDWGWAPFHYGRWDHDPYYSWYWVPGYEWSPAWVAWRDGGDYYGWAPLRPGINISIGFSIGSYSPPYDFWCFTPRRYILSSNPYNYYVDRRQNVTIINQTTIINNFSYNRNVFITGPPRTNFEVYTGRITPYRVNTISRPGRTVIRNNNVSVFRPNIRRDDNRRFAPRSVERYDRQAGNNNGRFDRSNNNNRPGNNNGRFDRGNNNNGRRDANINSPRNGNQPGNIDRGPIERRNDIRSSQRGNENRINNPVERGNNPRQPNNRQVRPTERPATGPGNTDPRRMERRNDQSVRQPSQRGQNEVTGRPSREMDRMPGQQPRQQRGNSETNRPSREMSQPRPQPSREVRQPRQQQSPSREVNQPRQQQAPRQMERRESNSRESNSSGNNRRGNRRGGN